MVYTLAFGGDGMFLDAPVSSEAFLTAARTAMDEVVAGEIAGVHKAADLIVASLRAGGVIQTFGSGHSEATAMEVTGRAGGLVPTNRLALRDIVIHGGESPDVLFNQHLEREPQTAHRLYEIAGPQAQDIFVVASNSGVNGSIVELAQLVKERGHDLIAITSADHSRHVASRHPSGGKLGDLADVVLDNGAPYGDVALTLPEGGGACAISSITAGLLAQMITAEVVRRLLDGGDDPPIYLSANIPGGDEHNKALEERYAGRIRRIA